MPQAFRYDCTGTQSSTRTLRLLKKCKGARSDMAKVCLLAQASVNQLGYKVGIGPAQSRWQ